MAASLAARKNFTMGSTVARGPDGKSEHSGKTASVVRCVVDHGDEVRASASVVGSVVCVGRSQ